jgi:hypothetical protein
MFMRPDMIFDKESAVCAYRGGSAPSFGHLSAIAA